LKAGSSSSSDGIPFASATEAAAASVKEGSKPRAHRDVGGGAKAHSSQPIAGEIDFPSLLRRSDSPPVRKSTCFIILVPSVVIFGLYFVFLSLILYIRINYLLCIVQFVILHALICESSVIGREVVQCSRGLVTIVPLMGVTEQTQSFCGTGNLGKAPRN